MTTHNSPITKRLIEDGLDKRPMRSLSELIAEHRELYRQLNHLVGLLEPLARTGRLAVPGLATLHAPRAILARCEARNSDRSAA